MGARLGRRAGPEAGCEAGAGGGPAPYERRVRWLREIQSTLRERQPERAQQLLHVLSQDLGLEGTLLTDILYRNVAFLNLVDPISHDLLVNLARDLQCPKKDCELWTSSDKICRQLIYHLTPHSKRQRGPSLPRRKSQSSLWTLPRLTQLLLNGNRLTRATARELTEAVKDTTKFPALAWVDLGNNVDVASLPQPLLVGLRRRLSQRASLPTIYEGQDLEPESGMVGVTVVASTWGSAAANLGSESQACCAR
ncbi:leucine-rich repeat-containing protein 75B isoform X2 [Dipodomys merriami]|uniref:leucine-rich repeat-containing protein 75B isoform X2 n=1 Tax=Dipodomys merriami TaxID=94247 RepID=UPI003855F13C